MKILLLEDDIALNRAIKKITYLDRHKTTSYFDGQDVYDTLEFHYDLYILDINVPHINGLKLLDIINFKHQDSKVIIISANTDINSLQKAYKLGCIDYLKKPFHLEELRIKINKLNIPESDLFKKLRLKPDISLTKREKEFLSLLLKHKDTILTYSIIEEHLYSDKSMSMDSLRALVRRVRVKLQDNIIQNVLEEGYIITFKANF